MPSRRSFLALFAPTCLTGCAWILYPERRFQENPGPIEVVPLVVDCLLFIPGIVPGIIALAVDFGTRAIYVPRGQIRHVDASDSLQPSRRRPEHLELRLLDEGGRRVARANATVNKDTPRQTLALAAPYDAPFRLELLVDGKRVATARIAPSA